MVSILKRMRKLQTRLLAIRLGSGAIVLPKDVKRIHLSFAPRMNGGHMGARKFWRHELVRMKYHNPSVPMSVERSELQDGPAVMSVHFAAKDGEASDRVESINMKSYTNSEILDALINLTKATPIEPTAEDRETLAKLQEQQVASERDSERALELRAKQKREQQILEQARGDVASQAA
ncbi:50s ribosomal protein mrp49 [Zymoseptoria brevis]|uniref:50s ribosomal protein mrp49 n=1 Tax=Zymoseptoria brevis TaxID=1047168 RepID=A0A0F4GD76_9PEZI|nr:50s ribosomal protein mrp49 [Zymoseptoria brevis]